MSASKNSKALKEWEAQLQFLRDNTTVNLQETDKEKFERIDLLKKDYKAFKEYYFAPFAEAETPDFHIKHAKQVAKLKKIFKWCKWGRGLAKSVENNVVIPLWLWIRGEAIFLVLIGENEDKAEILLDDIKLQFEGNQRLIHDFGAQKNLGHWEAGFFITKNSKFIAKAIGKGQEPRGLRVGARRPNLIVCDDWENKQTIKNPKRQDEDAKWLLTSIIPLMDGDYARVILAQNGFSPRMTFDKIIEDNEKGWIVDNQKAYDPLTMLPTWRSKYTNDHYKELEKVMGSIHLKAEYNNEPHVEGKIFTDELIQWSPLPRLNSFETIIGMWDVAYGGSSTSDYNAIRVWGLKNKRKYLIDCFVRQSKVKSAVEWIADYQLNLPKSVKVLFKFEAQLWNDEIKRIISEVEADKKLLLNLSKQARRTGKKYDHMITMLPQYENYRIYYNDKLKSHRGTQEGLMQLKSIEPGNKNHDDAPDADVYAFDYLDSFDKVGKIKPRIHHRQNRRY